MTAAATSIIPTRSVQSSDSVSISGDAPVASPPPVWTLDSDPLRSRSLWGVQLLRVLFTVANLVLAVRKRPQPRCAVIYLGWLTLDKKCPMWPGHPGVFIFLASPLSAWTKVTPLVSLQPWPSLRARLTGSKHCTLLAPGSSISGAASGASSIPMV